MAVDAKYRRFVTSLSLHCDVTRGFQARRRSVADRSGRGAVRIDECAAAVFACMVERSDRSALLSIVRFSIRSAQSSDARSVLATG